MKLSNRTFKIIYGVEVLGYAGLGYIFRNNSIVLGILALCFVIETYIYGKKRVVR